MKTATAVKERGILFSAPMVRAILDGKKTVTRRVIKHPIPEGADEVFVWPSVAPMPHHENPGLWARNNGIGDDDRTGGWLRFIAKSPYGLRGDRLYVKETFRRSSIRTETGISRAVEYRADGTNIAYASRLVTTLPSSVGGDWRPSIFLPRWASRITLEVVDVRAERVQDITDEDAEAEGAFTLDSTLMQDAARSGLARGQKSVGPVDYFRELWDQLNASRGFSWESNPYVWRVAFKRLSP